MKKFIWLIVGVGIGVIVFVYGQGPAKGEISKGKVSRAVPTIQEYIRYDGQNISFAYENKYELRENLPGMVWELVGKGVPVSIVIAYKNDSSATVEEVSGVKMRQIKKAEYKEESVKDGLLFSKSNPLELTAFFLKNAKALTVSMTANTNDDKNYKDEFLKFIDSIKI